MQIGNLNIKSPKDPIKVVFCLPGSNFSNNFLMSWTELLIWCTKNNIEPLVSCRQSSCIHFLRSMCVGASVLVGQHQKPFQGKVDADFYMWIDSDQVFTAQNFEKLLKHNKDIVSGLYLMQNGKNFTAVEKWDNQYYKKHGSFKFMTPEDIKYKKNLISVDYNGFGFMLIKPYIFEKIKYPWFADDLYDFGDGIVELMSEDVAFCRKVKKAGFEIYVDPTVIVGHEKKIII